MLQLVRLAFIVFLSILLFTVPETALSQASMPADWKPVQELKHPYLFFSEADKPQILENIQSTRESREIWDKLKMETNRLLYTPIEPAPPQKKNPRYDRDGRYNSRMSRYRHAFMKLAFMYQMTGEQKYADKGYEFADAVCAEPIWILKAHEFAIIYDRVWPWNAINNDDQVVFNYDIRTGDIATELGIAYDWLYSGLTKAQRDRIRGALLEKAILLARNNYDYHWWATSYKCNWNTICFSGLGVSAMALLTEDPSLIDVVRETYGRMNLFLNELGEDGGWQEGRGYWAYGMRAAIFFMESMRTLSDGQFSLYEHPKLQKYPVDFALYGLTGYFGDGTGRVVGSTHLINKLIMETKDSDAAWYREKMMRKGNSMFDLIWPRPQEEIIEPPVASRHFKSIDWAFMRSDFTTPEYMTVACKAGYNDDPHHGHLDIGQFSVYWHKEYFITDLGHGKYFYDEKYFNEARWDYPPASSAGHNLLYVNGEQQISAKYKNSDWKEGVGGEILNFRTSSEVDYTLMDPSDAYPGKELKGWRRHLLLIKPDIVLVLDEVTSEPGSKIETRFHPGVKDMEVSEAQTLLSDSKGHTLSIVPFAAEKLRMEEGRHAYLPVQKQADHVWIPYCGTHLTAQSDRTILCHLIAPHEKDQNLMATLENDREGAKVSFQYQEKPFEFDFTRTKDGLLLKGK